MSLKKCVLYSAWYLLVLFALVLLSTGATSFAQAPQTTSTLTKSLGTIQSISGNTLALMLEDGSTVTVTVPETVRIVRVAPGQKDLKDATPIRMQDLQIGDRVLVRGTPAAGKSLNAVAIIAMKKGDVESKQQKQREDWQKRGIGGLVNAVDANTGSVTIIVNAPSGKKDVAIRTSASTLVRRYAPDSVKFDDATPSTLAEVKPGDQLRARGQRTDDGSSFAADEIVFGSFRNIAGTISTVDAKSNTLSVADVFTKQPVQVHLTPDSQLRKLPPAMAQRIAQRMKGGAAQEQPASAQSASAPANAAASDSANGGSPRPAGSASGDLNQLLNRLPASALTDFQKGDAVMIVSTEGTGKAVTAITIVGGVEPILAAPGGSKDMVLSPWSLGGGGGSEGATP